MPDRRPEVIALGRAITHFRESKGWTITELSEVAGLSRRYVSQVERGTRNLTIEALLTLAEALGKSASDLLRRAEADLGEDRG
jgi:transcriptional regulator with XRE-family HTH domain